MARALKHRNPSASTGTRTRGRAAAAEPWHAVREWARWLLDGGQAHVGFERAVAGLPAKLRGARPECYGPANNGRTADQALGAIPHTPWRLVEHIRIAQWDILEFCRNPRHVSPRWPEGYWPAGDGPPDGRAWARSIAAFKADRAALLGLLMDPAADLLAPLPHGEGQTLLREALLAADHTAYHIGQLIVVRRALRAWED